MGSEMCIRDSFPTPSSEGLASMETAPSFPSAPTTTPAGLVTVRLTGFYTNTFPPRPPPRSKLTVPKPGAPGISFGPERRLCYKCIFSSDANLILLRSLIFIFYHFRYIPELSEAIRCCKEVIVDICVVFHLLLIYCMEPGSKPILRELVIVFGDLVYRSNCSEVSK